MNKSNSSLSQSESLSLTFFESLMIDSFSEHTFIKAKQLYQSFEGDVYLEKNERKLLKQLKETVFNDDESEA